MKTIPKKALVTGGAGFIGSHVVDKLRSLGSRVVVYDNFRTGTRSNLRPYINVSVECNDVLNYQALLDAMHGCDAVFHFQANADVKGGLHNLNIDFEQNTKATSYVLQAAKACGVQTVVFASSATVYGEPTIFPTPEDAPLIQTSLYGASKVAGEAMIQAYSEYFGIRSFIFRFVSWIGPRYSHGVVIDFLRKLKQNPRELTILGNGLQKKSYLDVRDGIDGIFLALDRATGMKNIFNLGHDDCMNVIDLAKIVVDEAGYHDVKLVTTGGERGWVGDSPFVHLDTTKIKSLGWSARMPIEQGIRDTVRHIIGSK